MSTHENHQGLAHLNLVCSQSSLLLERLLQTMRYRGFTVVNMNATELSPNETEVSLLVKGQAKLTTLQKSLEALIEVQQCYLTEDQAKLATLIEMGLPSIYSPTKLAQPTRLAAESA